MFASFLITSFIIGVFGPGHVEGGFQAIEDKGAKAALEQAWDERDGSSLKGNYGNQ